MKNLTCLYLASLLGAAVAMAGQPVCSRTIVGRHIFYNNSFYDTPSTACNNTFNGGQPCDDNTAVAPNLIALLPGEEPLIPNNGWDPPAALSMNTNYTSLIKGINGIMIDVEFTEGCTSLAGLTPPRTLTFTEITDTLEFIQSSGRQVDSLYTGATRVPNSVTIAPHPTLSNTDRIKVIFADNTSANSRWMRTRLLPGGIIDGLTPLEGGDLDRFYYGLAKAETLSCFGIYALVNNVDVDGIKPPHNHGSLSRAPINDAWDHDRDSLVGNVDGDFARWHPTGFGTTTLTCLRLDGIAP